MRKMVTMMSIEQVNPLELTQNEIVPGVVSLPNACAINSAGIGNALMNGFKIIMLSEDPPELNMNVDPSYILPASILMAPYGVVSCLLDNDLANARAQYFEYLSSTETDVYISSIVAALLTKNTRLAFYLGSDEMEIGVLDMLIEFITNVYGIYIDYHSGVVTYATAFSVPNLERFFGYDLINAYQYLVWLTDMKNVSINSLTKLVMTFNPGLFEEPYTPENYLKYFEKFRDQLLHSNGKPLQVLFVRDNNVNIHS